MFEQTRLRFFFSHLLLSLIISLGILGWIFWVWYPTPLFKALEVSHVFLMLIAIDIIIGPLLGFVVYKKGKKTLKLDLAIIIVIQVVALIYGSYSLEKARPVWIVYTGNNFDLVRKNEIIYRDLDKINEEYKNPSWFKPKFIAAEYSRDDQKKYVEMFRELNSGATRAQMPKYYKEIGTAQSEMMKRARKIKDLYKYNDRAQVDKILMYNQEATAWLPLITYGLNMVVLIDKNTGKVVKIVDLRPDQ